MSKYTLNELMVELHEPTPQFTREQAIEVVDAAQQRIADLEAERDRLREAKANMRRIIAQEREIVLHGSVNEKLLDRLSDAIGTDGTPVGGSK